MIRNISYKSRFKKFRYNNYIRWNIKLILIAVLAAICVIMFFPHFFRSTYKVTITSKQIIKHNNVDTYFIYAQTENGKIKVFENTNNLLEFKFNSQDIYWAVAVNKKYEIKAYGLSISPFSCYQNIIKVKGLDK